MPFENTPGVLPTLEPATEVGGGAGVAVVIDPRPRDLGGFFVRRVLPAAGNRMIGPFIFLDHMGPALMEQGAGLDVRPHPHIALATVTYLFEGEIVHRDNLGNQRPIHPGDVNWMLAGRGIAHSERAARNSGPAASGCTGSRAGWRCRRHTRRTRRRSSITPRPRFPG